VAVVCLLALALVAGVVANDVSAVESDALESNMSADDYDQQPFVPQLSEHDEVADESADEAVEESAVEDESTDAEDALEGNTEFDAALLQTDAEEEKAGDKAKKIFVKVKKALKKAKKSKKAKALRAPKPLKFKFHAERVRADSTKPTDPELEKLDNALAAVKEDILSTNKQITDERKWVIAVAKIIASYNDKMKRVEAHIIALRKEMKSLYRKKKQIENLKLQRALEAKLKEAKAELRTLMDSLKHVAVKRGELHKSGADLRNTIAGITAQLRKLRGQTPTRKACAKGSKWSRKQRKCVRPRARPAPRGRTASLKGARRHGKGKKARRHGNKHVKRV